MYARVCVCKKLLLFLSKLLHKRLSHLIFVTSLSISKQYYHFFIHSIYKFCRIYAHDFDYYLKIRRIFERITNLLAFHLETKIICTYYIFRDQEAKEGKGRKEIENKIVYLDCIHDFPVRLLERIGDNQVISRVRFKKLVIASDKDSR